ncbi:MAG: HAD hydrolase family protein [Treponema sp.]|jgi:hydroxymethylpyrimidine pyrophosphatase-like HAD family hydrolase|nr:HAD hydrolase family protein [Treponema sp.]
MKPVTEISAAEASVVVYVLMDIDDTLTTAGKLPAAAYAALWKLHEAGLKVIPVTGRPAGWCDLIAREWPVDGVVGENGALAFWEEPSEKPAGDPSEKPSGEPAQRQTNGRPVLKQEFHPNAVRNDHPVLVRIKEKALAGVPGLRPAKDQFARIFDIALDFAEEEPVLPLEAAEKVRAIAAGEGAMAKISSIHVNVWMGAYDKLSMAERFLQKRFGWGGDPFQVLFAGDSPNDEPMFARFPLACGVANVNRYRSCMKTLPAFVSSREGGEGFAEIVETVLRKR